MYVSVVFTNINNINIDRLDMKYKQGHVFMQAACVHIVHISVHTCTAAHSHVTIHVELTVWLELCMVDTEEQN